MSTIVTPFRYPARVVALIQALRRVEGSVMPKASLGRPGVVRFCEAMVPGCTPDEILAATRVCAEEKKRVVDIGFAELEAEIKDLAEQLTLCDDEGKRTRLRLIMGAKRSQLRDLKRRRE